MKITRRDLLKASAAITGAIVLKASGLMELEKVLAAPGGPAARRSDPALAKGLSTHAGSLLSELVAVDLGLPFVAPASVLA